jgi:hypothetical protein
MSDRKTLIINCQRCGELTTTGSSYGKYCDKCRHEINLEYRKKLHYKKRKSSNLVCQNCGEDLTNLKYSSKYCPNCRESMHKEINKINYQNNKEKWLEYSKKYYQDSEHKAKHRENALKSYYKKKMQS